MLTQKEFDKLTRGDPVLVIGYSSSFNNSEFIEAIHKNSGKLPAELLDKRGKQIIDEHHRILIRYKYKGRNDHQTVYIKHLAPMHKNPTDYDDTDIMEV